MAEQLNVFIENRMGRLRSVTKLLSDNNINIRALVIQDRGDFGVLKILANDPHRAHLLLVENGLAAALKKVLAIVIEDKTGGLDRLLGIFSQHSINILDAYGFVIESSKEAVWCVESDDMGKTKKIAEENGFKILSDTELYKL